MKFSVLISVYINEKAEWFNKALESILINQSLKPDDVVIVKDGPISEELEEVLQNYSKMFEGIIRIIPLEKNLGLGNALKIGLENCKYNLVARMDTDDISVYNRFEKQIEIFKKNKEVDLVGGLISEFNDNPDNSNYIRMVPFNHNDIVNMMKKRNPFNHVTVMFKKDAVIRSGSYQRLLYAEDYFLWVRLIENGYKTMNINDILVNVRTGNDMIKRRSNPIFIKSWIELQRYMKDIGLINILEYARNIIFVFIFMCVPKQIKKFIYTFLLRSKMNNK